MDILLFVSVVIVWGLTWFAIHLQVGVAIAEVNIFWRFAVATVLLGAWLALTRRLCRPGPETMPWLGLMGLCLFSCNFLALYRAATMLSSGVMAVVFSLASILNAINLWIFFRQRPDVRIIAGGILGVAGVGLLLSGSAAPDGGHTTLAGVGLALLGTTFFSLGNMVTRRIALFQLSLLNAVFYAMMIGTLVTGAIAFFRTQDLMLPMNPQWLGGLAYLSVFGSVVGFLTYLALVQRIGADRAAYTIILSPVVALVVSVAFEGTRWSTSMFGGLVLILAGNAAAFVRRRPVAAPVETEQG